VARTRRQGVEVGLQGRWTAFGYFVNYAYIDATYQSNETLASVTDPNGRRVQSGDHIPGIPAHNLKVGAEVEVLKDFFAGANVIYTSGSYLRGDDCNNQPKLDGYATLNLAVRYAPIKHLELWDGSTNVTNARYSTAGALNFNAFADPIAVRAIRRPGGTDRRLGGRQSALLRGI